MNIKNNHDLFLFMDMLKKELDSIGGIESSEAVSNAQLFASGSSSEFLHESREALSSIPNRLKLKLSDKTQREIVEAVRSIDDAFNDVGGA